MLLLGCCAKELGWLAGVGLFVLCEKCAVVYALYEQFDVIIGSACSSVGRVSASWSSGPGFDPQQRRISASTRRPSHFAFFSDLILLNLILILLNLVLILLT